MTGTLLCLALAATPPPAMRIAILDIKGRVGVSAALAQGLTDDVGLEVRARVSNAQVLGSDEIRTLIGFQKVRRQMGCSDIGCLAEIGGALGVDRMVTGSLGKFGSVYLLDLKLVDVPRAKVIAEGSERLAGSDDSALLDGVRHAVATLFPRSLAPPATNPALALATPAPAPEPRRSHLWTWVLGGTAVACAAVAVVGAVQYARYNSSSVHAGMSYSSYLALGSAHGTDEAWGDAAIGLGIGAALSATGAVIAW